MPDDAQRYHRLQLVLGLAAFALAVSYLVTLLLTGAATALDRAARTITQVWCGRLLLVAAGVALGETGVLLRLQRQLPLVLVTSRRATWCAKRSPIIAATCPMQCCVPFKPPGPARERGTATVSRQGATRSRAGSWIRV
jgi:hypothetical protein